MLAVSWINNQIVFDGIVQGLAIAVIAVGVVLVYRATRIINFAVGNMGVVGAAVLSLLVVQYHVSFWVGLVVALLLGLAFGAVVDMAIIRRLRKSPRVVVLVATIGVSQLAAAIAIKIPTPTSISVHYPSALSGIWTVGGVTVRGSDISILIIVPITLIALTWFLDRTTLGRTVKACASNPQLARLSSISPKMVSTMVWSLAAALSTLSVVLIAGQSGAAGDLTTLGPQTLSLALVAAVIGGMTSFRRTIIASVVIGLAQSLLNFNFIEEPGLINLLLLITVVVAVLFNRERTDENEVFAFTPRARPIPVRLRSLRWARNVNKSGVLLLAAIAVVLPLIFTEPSTQQTFTEVLAFAICATSLTVLTGWLGQLSLGQMAFAGLGALFAARLVEGGVPFWLAIVATTAGSAVLATLLGLSSLRVKGLYLAVVTFVFALAAQQYFFSLPILSGASSDGSDLPFVPGKLFSLSFPGQRTYYYVVLVILAVVLLVTSRFRDSGVGRSIMAVRDNESAAAAYRVRPAWEKIRAFALAGSLAGMGGALLSGAYANVAFAGPGSFFVVDSSLSLVAMVVIGGMGSVTAAVIGAIWVIGIPALAPNNQVLGLLTSSIGLLAVLLYFPRGLMQISYDARDAFLSWADKRFGKEVPTTAKSPAEAIRPEPQHREAGIPTLAVADLRVHFGGNVAVDGVTLAVGVREIVGLIGSNGAGKSTLMNAIGGFVPATGSVRLGDKEIGDKAPAYRAGLGLGRTFQSATLFPELTVTETLLVAFEGKGETGVLSTALALPRATRRSRSDRAAVSDLVELLGLGGYRDHYIADLSTGTRRVVELAGLLALNAKVLCLDEPTAGLAQRETEAFGPLIVTVQRQLDASVLLIEHDMPLIMGISDRVYCLEAGLVIAEGAPSEVRDNPRVIASYLGTDERAINRSGITSSDGSGSSAHASVGLSSDGAAASGAPAPAALRVEGGPS
jgi:ABC-type branched-subunit amino acid transport system ATPase component/ABC-type branched-subunit amino acid transport system permease subunit